MSIKSRIIPLPQEFIDYLDEDGIRLADSDDEADSDDDWTPSNPHARHHHPTGLEDSEPEDESPPPPPRIPPNRRFPALHQKIGDEIKALGGKVVPKLNWSAPRDATFISPHGNTLMCASPNDVYLILKSSSFINHDLAHAFDGCAPSATPPPPGLGFNPVLVLRAYFSIRTPLEFRCFVKHRNLVAISPRELKHYGFLEDLRPAIVARAKELFQSKLQFTFPDGCFTFDMYVPGSQEQGGLARARLVDINPWAPRTDPLLFDWKELLELPVPRPIFGVVSKDGNLEVTGEVESGEESASDEEEEDDEEDDDDEEEDDYEPELRLVGQDFAANLSSSDLSANKLPLEALEVTSLGLGGQQEIMTQLREAGYGRQMP